MRSFVYNLIKFKSFAGGGCHRLKLDEPRSEIFWSLVVKYAKSRKMRLRILGTDSSDRYVFNQTKYSNFTKIMKQLDNVDVYWIETFLPDNSTIEEVDSIMAGVKRLKEVN